MRTPKNPLDPRLLNNQRKFFSALNRILIKHPSISHQSAEVYTQAKLGHSTFFDHFKNLDHAHRTEIRLMRATFKTNFAKLDKTSTPQHTFRFIVVFIMKNRDFFRAATAMHDFSFFIFILNVARPILSHRWRRYRHLNKRIYRLYIANLLVIFEDWSVLDFSATAAPTVIQNLTSTANLFAAHLSDFARLAQSQSPIVHPKKRSKAQKPQPIKKEPK